MKVHYLAAAVVGLGACIAAPASASIVVNPSFETGLTGWTTAGTGSVSTVGGIDDQLGPANNPGRHFDPTDGQAFAVIVAGGPLNGIEGYTTLSQTFTLSGDSTLSLDTAFLAFDDPSFANDDGFVSVSNGSTSFTLFAEDIVTLEPNPDDLSTPVSTPWTHLSQTLSAGTWTLQAGARNVGDADAYQAGFDPKLLVDNVRVVPLNSDTGGVPEPMSWALMVLGFAAIGGRLRSRRSTHAVTG